MKKKITYRPSKAQGAFGTAVGAIFVLIGLTAAIPAAGAFGVLWTLAALGITGMNAYQAFGKGYAGPEIRIEDEAGCDPASSPETLDAKSRLEQLESLKDAGLITEEEYQEKRQDILEEL